MKINKSSAIILGITPSVIRFLIDIATFKCGFNPVYYCNRTTIAFYSIFGIVLSAGFLVSLMGLIVLRSDKTSTEIEKMSNIKILLIANILALIAEALLNQFLYSRSIYSIILPSF